MQTNNSTVSKMNIYKIYQQGVFFHALGIPPMPNAEHVSMNVVKIAFRILRGNFVGQTRAEIRAGLQVNEQDCNRALDLLAKNGHYKQMKRGGTLEHCDECGSQDRRGEMNGH